MKILAYGTLRPPDYNFERIKSHFGADSIRKIGEDTLPGFKMFNLGSYPGITAANTEGKIRVDVLEVNDQAADFIRRMELGAGYQEKEINGAKIYVYGSNLSNFEQIESGDWFHK